MQTPFFPLQLDTSIRDNYAAFPNLAWIVLINTGPICFAINVSPLSFGCTRSPASISLVMPAAREQSATVIGDCGVVFLEAHPGICVFTASMVESLQLVGIILSIFIIQCQWTPYPSGNRDESVKRQLKKKKKKKKKKRTLTIT